MSHEIITMKKKEIISLARELRKNQTDAEKKFWRFVRNRKFDGKKFLRQHPLVYKNFNGNLSFYISDFYCAEYKLVIELDGKVHDFQKDYDEQRDLIIQEMGIKVLRINNEELENINKVREKIRKHFISQSNTI